MTLTASASAAARVTGLDDDVAVETLIELSQDEEAHVRDWATLEAHVRDWATLGLARQIERDTLELRDTLLARLGDPDEDTRAEALAGLAERGDERAVDPLLAELDKTTGPSDPGMLVDALRALATKTGDPRLDARGWRAR